jgi:hypothetical protein
MYIKPMGQMCALAPQSHHPDRGGDSEGGGAGGSERSNRGGDRSALHVAQAESLNASTADGDESVLESTALEERVRAGPGHADRRRSGPGHRPAG